MIDTKNNDISENYFDIPPDRDDFMPKILLDRNLWNYTPINKNLPQELINNSGITSEYQDILPMNTGGKTQDIEELEWIFQR